MTINNVSIQDALCADVNEGQAGGEIRQYHTLSELRQCHGTFERWLESVSE